MYNHKWGILQGDNEELSSEFLKSIDEDYIKQRVNTLTRNTLLITTSPPHLNSWLTLYLEKLQKGFANLSAQYAFEQAKEKRVAAQKEFTGLPNDDEVSRAQGVLYKPDRTKEILLQNQIQLPQDDDDSDSL